MKRNIRQIEFHFKHHTKQNSNYFSLDLQKKTKRTNKSVDNVSQFKLGFLFVTIEILRLNFSFSFHFVFISNVIKRRVCVCVCDLHALRVKQVVVSCYLIFVWVLSKHS